MALQARKKIVKLDHSADDWQLYTSSCHGCNDAAHEINTAIIDAVNSGLTQMQTCGAALKVMQKYSHLGAMDSEPMYVLDNLLGNLFGRESI